MTPGHSTLIIMPSAPQSIKHTQDKLEGNRGTAERRGGDGRLVGTARGARFGPLAAPNGDFGREYYPSLQHQIIHEVAVFVHDGSPHIQSHTHRSRTLLLILNVQQEKNKNKNNAGVSISGATKFLLPPCPRSPPHNMPTVSSLARSELRSFGGICRALGRLPDRYVQTRKSRPVFCDNQLSTRVSLTWHR